MKTIAALLLSLSAATAFAAPVDDVPPVQAPAGSPASFQHFTREARATPVSATAAQQPTTRAERRAARAAVRAAKVGPKDIN